MHGEPSVHQNLQVTQEPPEKRIKIIRPALLSRVIVLIFEAVICIALSIRGIDGLAYYSSNSSDVAAITQRMWRAIDWTYIFYGLNYQLAAVLLAASPRWFLYQALGSNFLWMLPWAISYYAIIFGGAMVFDFFDVSLTILLWVYRLSKGRVRL
ncbi:uncharacterized protein N7496_004694 [Penicillium cataractarum]|uniref:Uncharacterized protein n=1 Tax=Penicillium cataractarum TaxID=2100454 RepID=A0A9W9SF63_9EURO|nr:uncharacterized protein N7496_004694 [Penicillium cataractarum]KAJ5377285.1 hypothetical protein N7496_004694 [Penicillium cataractarum]